jgi:hypothetical protein
MRALSIIPAAVALSAAVVGFGGPASAAEMFFSGDMVRGHTQQGATGPGCVLTSQYMRGESVVFRVRVLDDQGNPVDDSKLDSLAIVLGDGESIDMRYGGHPHTDPVDHFWATSWVIPADYPTGELGYKVVATETDGTTQEWTPFKVSSSELTVIPGEVTYTK